jgi:hypothetical protein
MTTPVRWPRVAWCEAVGLTSMKLLVALGAVALCLVATSSASGAQNGERVIRLFSTTDTTKERDKPPKGASKGDVINGTSILRNAVTQFGLRRGAVVGRDRYRLTFESPTVARVELTTTLPGGTIRCRGEFDLGERRNSIEAIGGTGIFRDATGACESTEREGRSSNVYRLQIPTAV